jgi:hypothetical protein
VFDNVGYTLAQDSFVGAGLIGFLKCSASIVGDGAFGANLITHVYCLSETIGIGAFQQNSITHVYLPNNLTILSVGLLLGCFKDNNIQYFNAPIIQAFGDTTGYNGVFEGNTGNNITAIVPSIHEISNAGGLEGDLQYLDDENTVDFVWDGEEVPTWISDPIFNPILLLDWQAIVIENETNKLHLKRTDRDRKLSLSFRMATQDNTNA